MPKMLNTFLNMLNSCKIATIMHFSPKNCVNLALIYPKLHKFTQALVAQPYLFEPMDSGEGGTQGVGSY